MDDYDIFLNTLPILQRQDVYKRLLAQLPAWFGFQNYTTPSVLNTVLTAYITTAYEIYQQLLFDLPQMRLTTITDTDQLNLFAFDFFQNNLLRNPAENNDTFKARIYANLFNIKATRQGMIDVLFNLTGYLPIIFEPWRALDCGGYSGENSGTPPNYSMGYSTHGAYGSASWAYQCFIDVYVQADQSMGTYPGYNLPDGVSPPYVLPVTFGCYSGESTSDNYVMQYGSESLLSKNLSQDAILKVINDTKVAGTICWVSINYINQ